ncbi:sulfate reduction electron transfer complex DsrMKJOP subunit DsrO [Calditrichota bacterium]
MTVDRRKFLEIAGLSAAGIACSRIGEAVASSVNLPQERPLTAKRWAMVIDLRKCKDEHDCTKCVDACHKIHNVPDFGNPKDEIKWLWKETFHGTFHEQEHEYLDPELVHHPALVLCNHCDNPPCVRVCPTESTWKREEDGIVMMDWHRCIGCRYCVVACPYGSRSFNWRDPRPFIDEIQPDFPTRMRGVVEKCTFCEERLAVGKMPACVDACEAKALTFGDLEDPESEVRQLLKEKFTIRRKPALGTQPEVYYIV